MTGIYHMKDVADYCGVSVGTVREWIDRGLRAFPLGHATRYEPRDYIIREEWLYAFLDAQSAVRPAGRADSRPAPPAGEKGAATIKAAKAKAAKGNRGGGNVLGPCPV